ncbi:MAG TPA: hypothetical protein VKT82_09060 [Ktedonobacterales bacterium]|nr:hypothetical protein [Ktedonobacterales bacterium]
MENPPDPPAPGNDPPPDDASPLGTPANPPAPAQPSRWQRVGAGIGGLGALLILCGVFLPTYGTADYEGAALQNAPLLVFGLLIAPALVILGISAWFWVSKPPLWLVVIGSIVIALALVAHWLISLLAASFACFDVCPHGGVTYGTGFWLPLIGLLLGVIGIIFAAVAARRPQQQPAPTA